MALGPQRQVGGLTLNMAAEQPGEAGGMVCRVASSGVEVVGYVVDITDLYPIGIQLHDVEFINEGYQYNPWTQRGVREVSKPHEIVGISTNCIVDTNFVALGAQPSTGKFAYLAPSGLITDDASFGGAKVGKFLSDLNDRNILQFMVVDSLGVHMLIDKCHLDSASKTIPWNQLHIHHPAGFV